MALKKSDLYSSLWQSCDELRGGMDASQYKDYILTLLFVKYVSDKAKSDPNSLIDVPPGGSFDDMVALKGDKEIGDKINKIIGKLAEANDLQKVIDLADFNDEEKLGKGKEMQDRLYQAGHDLRRPRLPRQPRRGRRPARRRLRVPDAALRHRVRQVQGPVLHAGRGLAGPGQGRRHRPEHTPGPDRLRPDLRLRLAAAQGRGRGAAWHHDLRPGEGQRHLGAVQDEHDPPRQRGRRHPQGRHDHQPAVHQRRRSCGRSTSPS